MSSKAPMASADERPKRGKGRPASRNPLSYIVNLRLTEADGQALEGAAEALNRDRADLAREILLKGLAGLKKKL